jgi:hypothetical protein
MARRRNSAVLRSSSLWRTLQVAFASCAILAGGLAFSAGRTLAAEGKRPVIGSVGSGAGGEITISADIDPENLETSYELRLECGPEEPMACDELPNEHTQGRLPPVEESREVSMTVTGLKPGKYWFGVSAVNADGEASWSSDILTVPEVPPGACPDGCSTTEPYTPPELPWANESGDIAAERTVQEQRAKEAVAAKEKEEAKAREASLLANEEAARKHRQEEEAAMATGSLSLAATNVTVQSNGMALVRLECLGIESCRGKLTLTAKSAVEARGKSKSKGKKASVGTTLIGTTSFSIPGDETKTVKVNLNAAVRALLSTDHGRCTANLALLELAPGPRNTQTKTVQLVQQKAHGDAELAEAQLRFLRRLVSRSEDG